jgi:hypothetical protein
MKQTVCPGLGLCLLLAAPAQAVDQGAAKAGREIACTYSHKNLMTSGEARLNLAGNQVSRLYFNIYYAGAAGALSYACDLAWNRGDPGYAWQDTAAGTVITIKETGDTVRLSRDKKKQGYVLNFANLNRLSKWCGAGAEVPEDVFIPLSGKLCKVTMPLPRRY